MSGDEQGEYLARMLSEAVAYVEQQGIIWPDYSPRESLDLLAFARFVNIARDERVKKGEPQLPLGFEDDPLKERIARALMQFWREVDSESEAAEDEELSAADRARLQEAREREQQEAEERGISMQPNAAEVGEHDDDDE